MGILNSLSMGLVKGKTEEKVGRNCLEERQEREKDSAMN